MSNYYYYYVHFLISNILIWYVLNDSFSLDFVNEFLTFFKVFLIFYFSFIDFSFLSLTNKILHLFFINFLSSIFFIKYQCIFFSLFSSNKIFFAYTLKYVKGWWSQFDKKNLNLYFLRLILFDFEKKSIFIVIIEYQRNIKYFFYCIIYCFIKKIFHWTN